MFMFILIIFLLDLNKKNMDYCDDDVMMVYDYCLFFVVIVEKYVEYKVILMLLSLLHDW